LASRFARRGPCGMRHETLLVGRGRRRRRIVRAIGHDIADEEQTAIRGLGCRAWIAEWIIDGNIDPRRARSHAQLVFECLQLIAIGRFDLEFLRWLTIDADTSDDLLIADLL